MLNIAVKSSSFWWRDLNLSLKFSSAVGEGWFDENLRRVVGDDRNTTFG
jgi:hypothetical protein